jgi:quercetin dioxygenase-like cupin family protein
VGKVKFRQEILEVQAQMQSMIASGLAESAAEQCTLTHYFTPKNEKYGCCTYAREIKLPKGSLVIGKIHRHQHLNFITQGKVIVYTEFGLKHLEAPCTFISEVGLKRAVYAVEDTLWTTVHLTEFDSEEELNKIEDEVIAPSYEDLGLTLSVDKILQMEDQGDKL